MLQQKNGPANVHDTAKIGSYSWAPDTQCFRPRPLERSNRPLYLYRLVEQEILWVAPFQLSNVILLGKKFRPRSNKFLHNNSEHPLCLSFSSKQQSKRTTFHSAIRGYGQLTSCVQFLKKVSETSHPTLDKKKYWVITVNIPKRTVSATIHPWVLARMQVSVTLHQLQDAAGRPRRRRENGFNHIDRQKAQRTKSHRNRKTRESMF